VSTEDTKLALIQKLVRAQRATLRQNWAWLSSSAQRDEIKVLKEQRDEYQQAAQAEAAERRRLYDETTLLRAALATSKDPCLYCQLPADEMVKCRSGFPGCARMDDLTGCPEFGAMMVEHDLRQDIVELKRRNAELENEVSGLRRSYSILRQENVELKAGIAQCRFWNASLLENRAEVEKERDHFKAVAADAGRFIEKEIERSAQVEKERDEARAALEIIDLYFAPWGAAKGARWEQISNDQPFSAEAALRLVRTALSPETKDQA
jgi:FtsZ-binding cell division protein ZapB